MALGPSFVVAQLSPERSLPSDYPEALYRTARLLPTHPFLALRVSGADIRFEYEEPPELLSKTLFPPTEGTYLLPVFLDPPSGLFQGCYLAIGPNTEPGRTVTVEPPLKHPHGRTLYIYTYLALRVRPPSKDSSSSAPQDDIVSLV